MDINILILLEEESNETSQIIMQNVFQIAKREGLLIVPLPSEHNSVLEKATRSIFAGLMLHCGLGKWNSNEFCLDKVWIELFKKIFL